MLTVGHGTLAAEAFAGLVRNAGVELVLDVRRYPASRRHPQFARDEMERWLPETDVGYRWEPALGGRRKAAEHSQNVALRNPQFRAYADYMASAEFSAAARSLEAVTTTSRAAVMCAESVWWRCHRRLISDYVVLVFGATVEHLFHDGRRAPHALTPGARLAGDHLVYDGGASLFP